LSITCTATSSSDIGQLSFYISEANTSTSHAGDAAKGLSIYGAQLRRASTSSTYLATTTVPQYAGLNGRAVPYFPGDASFMSRAFTAALDIGVGDNTIFAVVNKDGGADAANNFSLMGNETLNTNGFIWRLSGTNVFSEIRTNQAGANVDVQAETAVTGGVTQLVSWRKSGTTLSHYLSGASAGADDNLTNAVTSTPTAIWIGRVSQSLRGYLPEIIVFDRALSTHDRSLAESLLRIKHGM
jgi:hypothetical protein